MQVCKAKVLDKRLGEMHAFIMEHNVPELLEKRLNQTNLKQFLEENPESQPDCLNVDSEYSMSVRKK